MKNGSSTPEENIVRELAEARAHEPVQVQWTENDVGDEHHVLAPVEVHPDPEDQQRVLLQLLIVPEVRNEPASGILLPNLQRLRAVNRVDVGDNQLPPLRRPHGLPDTVEIWLKAEWTNPGGSIKDDEVIAAANEHGVAMIFTGMKHFRH